MKALGLALILSTAAACVAVAQPAPGKATPYVMARTEVRDIASSAGASYHVYVSWPEGAPPATGWPVLYVLDGDESFALAAQTAFRLTRFSNADKVTPGVVVAIGYPGASRRTLDYTPGPRTAETGGADAFLDFIAEDLQPAIARDYRIDANRQACGGTATAACWRCTACSPVPTCSPLGSPPAPLSGSAATPCLVKRRPSSGRGGVRRRQWS